MPGPLEQACQEPAGQTDTPPHPRLRRVVVDGVDVAVVLPPGYDRDLHVGSYARTGRGADERYAVCLLHSEGYWASVAVNARGIAYTEAGGPLSDAAQFRETGEQ